MTHLLAVKSGMKQVWTKSGKRMPVTVLHVETTTLVKSDEETGLATIATGTRKASRVPKPVQGMLKALGVDISPRKLKQVPFSLAEKKAGEVILPSEVFEVGDIVTVQGTSKGTGFTGVMKRHNFKGGPRTHGQSDRERAPGSIGQGTTPGRVYPGKKMAGRGGGSTVSMLNLTILKVDDESGELWVSGPLPGAPFSTVLVKKTGALKKFEELQA